MARASFKDAFLFRVLAPIDECGSWVSQDEGREECLAELRVRFGGGYN